ncbi:MAG: hypothetical protein IT473_00590 [Lysobacter sp.]|nr:hypothetical protein [Lysobacter sp.]
MNKILLFSYCFTALFTCSCATTSFTAEHRTDVPCAGSQYCAPEDLERITLETLKSNGNTLSLTCGSDGFDIPISELLRAKCRDRVERMALPLSEKWPDHLRPIDSLSIAYSDHTAFLTLVNGVCLEENYIEAKIPLSWISK